MKRQYTTIPFGKGEKRVVVTFCRKPMQKGLAGYVRGKSLSRNLALIVSSLPVALSGFEFAALADYGGDVYGIIMTPEIFHGIRRGDTLARTCLFHELGHYLHRNSSKQASDTASNDQERFRLASEGTVSPQELEADACAAGYLGSTCVIEGLTAIWTYQAQKLPDPSYDREDVEVAIQELDQRITVLQMPPA